MRPATSAIQVLPSSSSLFSAPLRSLSTITSSCCSSPLTRNQPVVRNINTHSRNPAFASARVSVASSVLPATGCRWFSSNSGSKGSSAQNQAANASAQPRESAIEYAITRKLQTEMQALHVEVEDASGVASSCLCMAIVKTLLGATYSASSSVIVLVSCALCYVVCPGLIFDLLLPILRTSPCPYSLLLCCHSFLT